MACARRKGLSLKRKIEIIEQVERHSIKPKKMVADEYAIPRSTLATILAS